MLKSQPTVIIPLAFHLLHLQHPFLPTYPLHPHSSILSRHVCVSPALRNTTLSRISYNSPIALQFTLLFIDLYGELPDSSALPRCCFPFMFFTPSNINSGSGRAGERGATRPGRWAWLWRCWSCWLCSVAGRLLPPRGPRASPPWWSRGPLPGAPSRSGWGREGWRPWTAVARPGRCRRCWRGERRMKRRRRGWRNPDSSPRSAAQRPGWPSSARRPACGGCCCWCRRLKLPGEDPSWTRPPGPPAGGTRPPRSHPCSQVGSWGWGGQFSGWGSRIGAERQCGAGIGARVQTRWSCPAWPSSIPGDRSLTNSAKETRKPPQA